MARPKAIRSDGIPARLATFRPADWPADDVLGAYLLWRSARRAFIADHPWPGGALTMVMEERAWNLRLFGHASAPVR